MTDSKLKPGDPLPDDWTLGQCVYKMSTGKRCPRQAVRAVVFGPDFVPPEKRKAYGYCSDHAFAIMRPRDPQIHRTAEPLTRVESEPDDA